jgi:membrane protease YdiL (CAAX protease family)
VSARAPVVAVEPSSDARTAVVVVVVGCSFLALRAALLGRADAGPLLAVGYAGILIAALLVPAPAAVRPSVRTVAVVAAVGIAAVVAAAALAGPPVAAALPWWAPAMNALAAVAEEALFRRTAYGRLAPFGPVAAVAATAVLFALVHVPVYGISALPVDLGAGALFGWQRAASGSWSAPAATHVFANLMAVIR